MPNGLKAKADSLRRTVPDDRIFTPVNDLLIILSAIAHASSLMVGGSTHTTPQPTMRVRTRWPDYGLAVPLRGPLEHAIAGTTPTLIEIGIITTQATLTEPMPNVKAQTGELRGVLAHAISPIFLMFFERYNDWMTATHGDAVNWPPTLNFSRVIRNAAAHGKINIRNPGAPPVSWRGLTYGPADNGRQIIGPDIQLGEMLALIFDASDALDALSAPVL
jgi:hypothetical protein